MTVSPVTPDSPRASRWLLTGVRGLSGAVAILLVACSDSVGPPVPAEVELDATSVTMTYIGEQVQLTATIRDQGGNALSMAQRSWHSLDETVATVSQTGLVTAVGSGSTQVSVRSGSVSGSVPVTVSQEPVSVELEPDSVTLGNPGDTTRLVVAVLDFLGTPVAGAPLVWSSGDSAVAVVDGLGRVTAVGTGRTYIRAVAGAARDSTLARVVEPLILTAVDPVPTEAPVASEVVLRAVVTDGGGTPRPGASVSWSADALSGAITSSTETVTDANGMVSATWTLASSAGPQHASASVQGAGSLAFTVEATPGPAASAFVTADSVLLSGPGEQVLLAATVVDSWGNPTSGEVTWSSGDSNVATAETGGLVTASGPGVTWVRATLGEPVDSLQVTVELRGAITLTFDDGWLSVYDNAWPVIQEFPGLRANIGVYTEAVGWEAFVTEAHLDELHQAGWSMVSHTVTHDSLSTLTAADLEFELRESQAWLQARGYRGTDILIAPYHDLTAAVEAAAAQYYVAGRGMSATETEPETMEGWMPTNPFGLTAVEADLLPYTSAAGREKLRGLLQRAVDEGAFLDVFFHQVPTDRVGAFRALLQVLWEFRDRVLPYHELFPPSPRVVR
jgi:hypothetical protein